MFAVESCSFHQNAYKLTSNTKSGQILNIVIKVAVGREILKSINVSDIFKAVMTAKKFAKSEHYTINRKYFHPKNK